MSIYAPKKPSKLNGLNVTLALIFLIGGYFGWWFLPTGFAVWSVTGAMASECNSAYREFDDAKLLARLVASARRSGLTRATNDNFAISREPPTDEVLSRLTTDSARDLFRKRGASITISFAITVNLEWPIFGGSVPMTFERERTQDLTAIQY